MTTFDNEDFNQVEPEIDRERVLPQVLRLLGVSDRALSSRELRTFSGLSPDDRRFFWPTWQAIGDEQRAAIARAMVEQAEDSVELDFTQIWFWLLEDANSTVRAAAIEGLWEQESPAFMRRLLELLEQDPAPEVRAAAALGLASYAKRAALGELPSAEDALRAVLQNAATDRNQSADVRRRALESLGYFGDDQALKLIDTAYASKDQLLRESAVVAMGRTMDERYIKVIGSELTSPSPAMRYEAARAAGEYGEDGRSLLPRLVSLADEEDSEIAVEAIWALGQIGGPNAKRALQRMTQSRDDVRREAAEEALVELSLDELTL